MLALGVIVWLGAIACIPFLMYAGRPRHHYGLSAAMIIAGVCIAVGTMLIGQSVDRVGSVPILYAQVIGGVMVFFGCIAMLFEWRQQQKNKRFQAILEEYRNKK